MRNNVQPTPAPCGDRKPGWEHGPAIGRHRIPCTLPAGHDSVHRDALRQTWPRKRADFGSLAAAVPGAIRAALQTVLPDRYTPELAEQIAADVLTELEASLDAGKTWSAVVPAGEAR